MIQTGHLIGGYRIEGPISGGGMAMVYRARRLRDGLVVALKVLRDQYAADVEFVQRFQREAQAAASLSHANMVQVYESGRTDGIHFIAMEYVEGQDLKQHLRRHPKGLPPDEAVRIAAQVCEVLDYAHKHGIIHRDIKPQNILLARDGTVKVADFGIARALSAVTITQTGTVLGSVQYLSPEQARGQNVGRAADLYALAVVLFEMVTGRLPFDGDSPIAIALRHIHDAPPLPSRFSPAVSPELEAIILRGMAKSPRQRYSSARDLASDLRGETRHWRVGTRSRADDVGATQIARPSDRRNRGESRRRQSLRVPVGTVAALVLIGMLGGGLWAGWRSVAGYLNVAEVEVPQLVGMPLPDAQAAAGQARLALAVEGRAHSDDIAKEAVVSQDQPAGKRVKVGRVLNVVVSLGPEMVTVPDVQGQPLVQARLAIEDLRLRMGKISEMYDDVVRGGVILTQDPPPNRPVKRGTAVNVVVSRGPELVEVPVLVGRSLREARRRLEELGLILRHVQQALSPDLEPGIVVDQTPAPGTRVKVVEAEVVLTVSVRPGGEGRPPDAPVVTVERKSTPAPGSGGGEAGRSRGSGGQGERQTAVRVVIPEGEASQRVKIVVVDETGVRTAYDKNHSPGQRVNLVVRSRGYTIIQVYVENRLVQEIRP